MKLLNLGFGGCIRYGYLECCLEHPIKSCNVSVSGTTQVSDCLFELHDGERCIQRVQEITCRVVRQTCCRKNYSKRHGETCHHQQTQHVRQCLMVLLVCSCYLGVYFQSKFMIDSPLLFFLPPPPTPPPDCFLAGIIVSELAMT